MKLARSLGVWFHRTYGGAANFAPGVFIPPAEPVDASIALREEIEALRAKVVETEGAADAARRTAEEEAHARESLEQRLSREATERSTWEQLAQEIDAERASIAGKLAELQASAEAAPRAVVTSLVERGELAATTLELDEAETRALIDQQLRDRGWEVDTKSLRYASGVRPAKGKNMAIAEWPTQSGPADYALFVGTRLIGLVEAKRRRKNVSAAIDQAERYSLGIDTATLAPAGGPWHKHKVPFVFAANGRSYLKQIETESGIWFRDTRRPTNHRRALVDWPTPDGLTGLLEIDQDAASAALKAQPFDFGFPLRPYQEAAIRAVEAALSADERSMLVAMATGTGKTKLAIALLYRLLAAKRFRRICFVVDRSALGHQTEGEFSTTKVVSGKTFSEKSFDLIREAACERRFLSYKQLADGSGAQWSKVRYAMNAHLGDLLHYAHGRGWPLLSAIVVNQQNIASGEMEATTLAGFVEAAKSLGYSAVDESAFLREQQQRVFDWAVSEDG